MRQGADRAALSERVTWHRYVPVDLVEAYLALGWVVDGLGPLPGVHGLHRVLMEWAGDGDPAEPKW